MKVFGIELFHTIYKFYCPQCNKGTSMPHPFHGGCKKCGGKLIINPEWKQKNDKHNKKRNCR